MTLVPSPNDLQRSKNLGPHGDHAEKQGDRGQSGGFLHNGAKHDVLPERRENIVHVMFFCQASPVNHASRRSRTICWNSGVSGRHGSSTIRPSRIVTRRSMRAAMSMLWVASMTVEARRPDQLRQRVEHMVRRVRIEIAGRLVGQQDPRHIGDRARDRDALLLAARELGRPVRQPLAEAQIGQQLARALVAPRCAQGRGSSAAA